MAMGEHVGGSTLLWRYQDEGRTRHGVRMYEARCSASMILYQADETEYCIRVLPSSTVCRVVAVFSVAH